MNDVIQVSGFGYMIIDCILNVFNPRLRYYSLKYVENGAEHFSIKFDIKTLSSLLTSLFSIQSYIQGNENYINIIDVYPGCIINISRYKDSDCVIISCNNNGFKIENGYIGRVFSNVEDIFLDSTIPNNDYFL